MNLGLHMCSYRDVEGVEAPRPQGPASPHAAHKQHHQQRWWKLKIDVAHAFCSPQLMEHQHHQQQQARAFPSPKCSPGWLPAGILASCALKRCDVCPNALCYRTTPGRRCSFEGETIGEFPTSSPVAYPGHRHLRRLVALMTCHILCCLPLFERRWYQVARHQSGSRSPVPCCPARVLLLSTQRSEFSKVSPVVVRSCWCSRLPPSASLHPSPRGDGNPARRQEPPRLLLA